jgi:hypothetical protein
LKHVISEPSTLGSRIAEKAEKEWSYDDRTQGKRATFLGLKYMKKYS